MKLGGSTNNIFLIKFDDNRICPFMQKRNMKQNVRLISIPIFLCIMLLLLQILVNLELDKPKNRCGCVCIDTNGDGTCEKVCGLEYSTLDQAATCPIPHPPEWFPLLQMPGPDFRAVISDVVPYRDLPSESCRRTGSCPVAILFTGNNHSLGEGITLSLSLSLWYMLVRIFIVYSLTPLFSAF